METSTGLNTILISTLIGIIVAGGGYIVAWLNRKTRLLNEMAIANNELLEKNTEIAKNIERQTDGLNRRMAEIAAAAAFTKGQIKGRKEGEGTEPYEELKKLEDILSTILPNDGHSTLKKPKP